MFNKLFENVEIDYKEDFESIIRCVVEDFAINSDCIGYMKIDQKPADVWTVRFTIRKSQYHRFDNYLRALKEDGIIRDSHYYEA